MTFQPSPTLLGKDDVYIVTTLDGSDTLFSYRYGTTYHSLHGAVSESRHIFILHGLNTQQSRQKICILEIGFGTGLNAFLAYLYSKKFLFPIDYTGIEPFQVSFDIACRLDYPGYLAADDQKNVFLEFHRQHNFADLLFSFKKYDQLDSIAGEQGYDCIFFDAFSPSEQPEMWEQQVFDNLFHLTSVGGCLVTYCAKGEVRRRLIHSGYQVKRMPGGPGKREMIQAFRH